MKSQDDTYELLFPLAAPAEGQVSTYVGGELIWTNVVAKGVVVVEDPQPGSFPNITEAIASLVGVSESNPYVVYVNPGIYTEPATVVIPSYVTVTGVSQYPVTVKPGGNFDLFRMEPNSSLNFIQIMDVPNGYVAIDLVDSGDFVTLHKVEITDCDTAIRSTAVTEKAYVYLEYVSITDCNLGLDITSVGGVGVDFNVENFEIFGVTDGITISGTGATLTTKATNLTGDGTGTAITFSDGAGGNVQAILIDNFATGVVMTTDGSVQNVQMTGINFRNVPGQQVVAAPTSTGFITGFVPYEQITIPDASSFFLANSIRTIVTVGTRGANFTSINDALDAIVDATSTKRYIISVSPGVYTESPITLKQYVYVIGAQDNSVIINPSDLTQDFITAAPDSGLMSLTIGGPTTSGKFTIVFEGDPAFAAFYLTNLFFNSTKGILKQRTTGGNSIVICLNIRFPGLTSVYDTAFDMVHADDGNFLVLKLTEYDHGATSNPTGKTMFKCVSDISNAAFINRCFVQLLEVVCTNISGTNAGTICDFSGCMRASVSTLNIGNAGTAISIPAYSVLGPNITFGSVQIRNSATNISITDPNCVGIISGIIPRSNVSIVDPAQVVLFLQDPDGGITMVGDLYQGSTHNLSTNISNAIQFGSSLGATFGGDITYAALNVTVSAGAGYVQVGSGSTQYIKYVEWVETIVPIPDDSTYWIYIDSNGVVQTNVASPTLYENIRLVRVTTSAGNVLFIAKAPYKALHTATLTDRTARVAFANIFATGCIAESNGANMKVDVSSGRYFYSYNEYLPSAGTAITMITFYRDGVGGQTIGSTTDIPVFWDNNSGTPQAIGVGKWVKHCLYVVGDGVDQKYLLLYGQEEFNSQVEAEDGDLPAEPSSFGQNVVTISGIIVTNGDTSLPANRFRDVRPTVSFRSGQTSATSIHNNLSGLTTGDPHTQYLPVSGLRSMTGNLDMGTNQIVNAGNINGVTITAHAARHLPGGADELTTLAPVTINTANSIGVQAAFARSDHVHAHGAQTDATLHAAATALANGFMTSTDKSKLDASTSNATASTLVQRSGAGAASFSSITIQGDFANVFNPSGSQLADVTYTLPPDSGTAGGQFLTTNFGVLTWTSGLSNPATTTGDMIYSNPGSALTRLPIGSIGQMLRVSTSTLPSWTDQFVPSNSMQFYDDFTGFTSPFGDTLGWGLTTSGTGSTVTTAAISPANTRAMGIISLTKGTIAAARASLNRTLGNIFLGFGSMKCEIGFMMPILPTVTDNFFVRVGFGDSNTNAESTDGVYFYFDIGLSASNWNIRTISNNVITTTTTASTVTAGQWQRLGIEVNSDGTLATFLVGGVSIGTINTNIPIGSARAIAPMMKIDGNAGTVARSITIDYFYYTMQFETNRY